MLARRSRVSAFLVGAVRIRLRNIALAGNIVIHKPTFGGLESDEASIEIVE
jgi:hypothetical protein